MDSYSTYDGYLRLMKNAEPLTFLSRQPGGVAPLVWTLPQVERRPATTSEETRGPGIVSNQTGQFRVWQAILDQGVPVAPATGTAPAPKVNDQFTDANAITYVVDRVAIHLFGNVFDCDYSRARGGP